MGCLFSRNTEEINSSKNHYDLDLFDYNDFFENKDPNRVTNPLHDNDEIDYSQFFKSAESSPDNYIEESYESVSFHKNNSPDDAYMRCILKETQLINKPSRKTSVTYESNLIYPYKKTRWNISGTCTKELGKKLHEEIEDYLNHKKIPSSINSNFQQFLHYYKEHIKEVLFIEKTVENNKYIGVVDAIIKNYSDEIVLIDWKCTDKIDLIGYGFDEYFGYGISNYQRYSFQLNIYYHLCLFNNIKIDSMNIVQFTNSEDYHIYPVELEKNYLEYFNGKLYRFTVPDILAISLPFGKYKGKYINQVPVDYVKFLACYKIQDKKIHDNFDGDTRKWLLKNSSVWIKISRMYLDDIKLYLL